MLGLGKYSKSWFYMEYSIYMHVLVLWTNGCQFFRNCMSDATYNKSFDSILTAINEVRKRIDYTLDNIFVFFYRSDLGIEAFTGYKNMTC